jgi:hypothetical protein
MTLLVAGTQILFSRSWREAVVRAVIVGVFIAAVHLVARVPMLVSLLRMPLPGWVVPSLPILLALLALAFVLLF